MRRLWQIIRKYDKIAHGCTIAAVMQLSHIMNIVVVIVFACVISVGKEIYDKYKPNPTGFGLGDLLADFIGMVVGICIYLLTL